MISATVDSTQVWLNNTQIIKIINMYSIARFLLPNYLKYKKDKLFHLLIITENWPSIIIEITSNNTCWLNPLI